MGQVPAKQFPSPTSFGQAPLNGVLQSKMTPQAPQMQFPSLSIQQGAAPATGLGGATNSLLKPIKPPTLNPKPLGGLKGF